MRGGEFEPAKSGRFVKGNRIQQDYNLRSAHNMARIHHPKRPITCEARKVNVRAFVALF
jgi:hypothetical protein